MRDKPRRPGRGKLAEVEVLCRDAGRADRFEWIKDIPIGQKGALNRATYCERIA